MTMDEGLTPEYVARMFGMPPEILEDTAAEKARRDARRAAYMKWLAKRSRELEVEFSELIAPQKEIGQ